MNIRYLAVLVSLFGTTVGFCQSGPAVIRSPDRRLAVKFETMSSNQPVAMGRLVYSVTFKDKLLLEPSGLALDLENQTSLGTNVQIVQATASTGTDNYTPVTGKALLAHDSYDALQLQIKESGDAGRVLQIQARAYNDAIAFRYIIPAQAGVKEVRLSRERTEFRLSKDATTYSLVLPHYRSMYESEFLKLPASAFSNQGGVPSEVLIGLPMLLNLPGVAWMAISEADMRDNAAMYLTNPSRSWLGHWFESRLAPHLNETNICVTGTLPYHSAWRVLLVASEPGRLIESTVITSLNPPSAIQDTSWIHAGKAAWDWWSGSIGADGKRAFTTENMKYYVDFAAKSGFEYMLVDAGWAADRDITRMNGRVDIPGLVKYAATKKVKVWIWLSYRDASKQMNEAFPLYEKWGIAGVKIDFVERDDQEGIDFYYRAARKAAEHHLMVDFHGCTKPTGMERTWPNVMGYEAVCGMEQSKAGARDDPEHHVTLPFTRMLAGPMDYTPGGFRNVTREDFQPRMELPLVMGTRAQQLAMYVVYQAPFQMVSDCPLAYEGQPSFQFIKDVPATWDETKVLSGEPDEYIVIARRRGSAWFLGSMTDWRPRHLEVPLSFLPKGRFSAEIYSDAPDADKNPAHVAIEKKIVHRWSRLKADLAPGGGYAARFVPTKP